MTLFRPVKNPILRACAWLVTLVMAIALVVSAYGGTVNPLVSPLGAVAAMFFPFVLVLSLLLLIINIIWFRKTAILSGLSLMACAGPILTYCPLNIFRPSMASIEKSHSQTIKVMTYNMLNLDDFTKGACSLDAGNPTVNFVLAERPDILLSQESEQLVTTKKNITPQQQQLLQQLYPYRHVNARGMGIHSRYPVEIERVEHNDRWLYDVERYKVYLPGDTVTIFNVHLQSLGLKDGAKAVYHEITSGVAEDMSTIRKSLIHKLTDAFRKRAIQAQVVRDVLDSVSGSVMVCGDFNDIPGCYALRTIEGNTLKDAYRQAGIGPAITYHADRFYFRIDHILYGGGRLKPLRVWRGDNPSSDHYPLIAIFEIEE